MFGKKEAPAKPVVVDSPDGKIINSDPTFTVDGDTVYTPALEHTSAFTKVLVKGANRVRTVFGNDDRGASR